MKIEKRNAWQNKPHTKSKSMAEGKQGKDEDGQKKCMQNKPHGDRKKECMAK